MILIIVVRGRGVDRGLDLSLSREAVGFSGGGETFPRRSGNRSRTWGVRCRKEGKKRHLRRDVNVRSQVTGVGREVGRRAF